MQKIKNLTYCWLVGIKLPSVVEFQPSSHLCVVCWLCADPPWCSDDLGYVRWQSCLWRCPTKLLLPGWANPRLGVVSLFLVAGAGVDGLVSTTVLYLVSPTAQIVRTMGTITELSPKLSPNPVQVWPALFQLY